MKEMLNKIRSFVAAGSCDPGIQSEFIKFICDKISSEFEAPLKIYHIHTNDSSTNVRFYITDFSSIGMHFEGYFGVNYDDNISTYCEILAFINNERVVLANHKRHGSILKLEFIGQGDETVIVKKWDSDSYGEWESVLSPAWEEYKDPARTFDRVDPSPWDNAPIPNT